ncbi:MAG: response regulator transcription factor [Elainellaceae cyanobacterium]
MSIKQPRVLLIEDEFKLAQYLYLEFQDAGYDVTMAHSGLTGIELLMAQPFDLVVLDWNLPQLSGLAICERLRMWCDRALIVMMTAYDDPDKRRMAYRAGVDEYLIKPFSVDQIMGSLNCLLATNRFSVISNL